MMAFARMIGYWEAIALGCALYYWQEFTWIFAEPVAIIVEALGP